MDMKKQKIGTTYRIKIRKLDYNSIKKYESSISYIETFVNSYISKGFDLFDFDQTGLYYSVDYKHDKRKKHKKLLKAFKKYIIKCKRYELGK